MSDNLFTRLSAHFPSDRTTTFLRLPDGSLVTYGDLEARTAQFANALGALGVKTGDRVAAHVDKSVEALLLYLGTIRAGAVFLPLNTAYTVPELEYFLSDAEPSLAVCRPSEREGLEQVAAKAGVPTVLDLGADGDGALLEPVAAASSDFEDVERAEDDLAAILYTSGTTGRSKGAMLTHLGLGSNAEALRETWQFTEDDRLLHALPMFHTHGLFTATNTILRAGASMIYLPRFDVDQVISLLPEATTMMGVPTFYIRLLTTDKLTPELVAHMRLFISGSAPLSPEVHSEFEARTGKAILERYGMTETSMNTSNPYEGERRAGTVGMPLPGVEVRVAERETGKVLETGEVGVVEVRGPNVFKGYWRNPEKTREEFRDDKFFITGDLGMFDERGYLHIVGRDKDLIISGGFNVYPAEVEAIIDAIPGVSESAVIGVPHRDFGEGVTAVIALKNGASLAEDEVLGALNGELAKFKQPKRVFFVDSLPRNTMGKIQKKELREIYAETYM